MGRYAYDSDAATRAMAWFDHVLISHHFGRASDACDVM